MTTAAPFSASLRAQSANMGYIGFPIVMIIGTLEGIWRGGVGYHIPLLRPSLRLIRGI